jgi:hypothetical protein
VPAAAMGVGVWDELGPWLPDESGREKADEERREEKKPTQIGPVKHLLLQCGSEKIDNMPAQIGPRKRHDAHI